MGDNLTKATWTGQPQIQRMLSLTGATAYRLGDCNILVSRDETTERGLVVQRWHLSISHPTRYPTWDEIKAARYALLPDDMTMAMLLPPKAQYVNIEETCFHLTEIERG
jgi:hypothetical protein